MEIEKYLKKNCYIIISSILTIFEILIVLKRSWVGDFWEHSAVVNELSKHLIHPSNPILKIDIPHAFFSPYSVCVALFSKITNLNSIQSLECFAIVNLLLFLSSFYLFCKSLFKSNHSLIASLSLFFILFLWGRNPFMWSGFFHFMVLNYVLPYPSTFAMSLSFYTLSLIIKNHQQKNYLRSLFIIVLCAIVFITHPTTAIFLFIGILSLDFSLNNSIIQCFKHYLPIILLSFALCLLWPYYNIVDLFFGNNKDFNNDSLLLYSSIAKIFWPILLVIPAIIINKNDKITVFFTTAITLMLGVYIGGYIFKFYGVSRIISGAMIFMQILTAYTVVLIIRKGYRLKQYLMFLISCITISIVLNFKPISHTALLVFKLKNIEYYSRFEFLRKVVKPDDIILANRSSNWLIPSFNGKVLSSVHPIYWITDIDERRNIVDLFFKKGISDSIRQFIINKYHPKYLLVDFRVDCLNATTYNWIRCIGQTVYYKDQLELIKFK